MRGDIRTRGDKGKIGKIRGRQSRGTGQCFNVIQMIRCQCYGVAKYRNVERSDGMNFRGAQRKVYICIGRHDDRKKIRSRTRDEPRVHQERIRYMLNLRQTEPSS